MPVISGIKLNFLILVDGVVQRREHASKERDGAHPLYGKETVFGGKNLSFKFGIQAEQLLSSIDAQACNGKLIAAMYLHSLLLAATLNCFTLF
jgi:hypothetical protein